MLRHNARPRRPLDGPPVELSGTRIRIQIQAPYTPSHYESLCATLRIGDVLLVEGRHQVATAIKYLTRSTWSHAALYVGDLVPWSGVGERPQLVEVDLGEGCIAVPLSKYAAHNSRICRPRGRSSADRSAVARYTIDRIGRYDHRNILDLARYFLPTPPVPLRWRRRMLALGSGDPTRAICSSLIAQAFQSVRYPILPDVHLAAARTSRYARREIYHIRHHSLFVPRDFDLSPLDTSGVTGASSLVNKKVLRGHGPL